MGQVGITNPFTKVPDGEYGDYGVPGIYPTGIGSLSQVDCALIASRMGPPTPAEIAACQNTKGYSGPTMPHGSKSDLMEHLNGDTFGLPNWFLYAGAGLLAFAYFGEGNR